MAHVAPNVVQQAFRVRNDDGSETSATWKESINGDVGLSLDEVFRVRFLIEETAGGAANNASYILQYSINGGAWTLTDASTTPVQAAPSAFVANGTATTQQLGTGDFVAGEFDSSADTSNISLTSQQTEMEYCLILDGAQVSFGDTIQLRVTDSGTVLSGGYANTPTISVAVIGDLAATLAGTAAEVEATFTLTFIGDLTGALGGTELTATAYHIGAEYVESYYVEGYYVVSEESAGQIPTGDLAATLEGASTNIGMTRFPAYWKKISGTTTILAGEVSFYVVLQVDPDNNGGWWFDEVVATVNDGANQLTNGTFNDGTKTGWTANPEQDGVVVDPSSEFDPPGAHTLQIDADPSVVQQQASDSFAVTEGDIVYVEAWVYFYGGVNSNGKANGRAKNASDEVVRTATIAQTSPDPDVVTGELAASLVGTAASVTAGHGVVGTLATTLANTTAAMDGEHTAQVVTGDIAAALEGSSVSSTGDHGVVGDLATTLGGTAAALSGEHLIAGDLAAQIASTTAAIDGSFGSDVVGDLAAQLADTTLTMTGDHGVTGDLVGQLGATAAAIDGDYGVRGDAAATLADTTAAITGEHLIAGDLSAQLEATTASLDGTVGAEPGGSMVATLESTSAAGEGDHGTVGSMATSVGGLSLEITSSHGVQGSTAAELGDTAAAMSGEFTDVTVTGDIDVALADTAATGTGSFTPSVDGDIQVSLEGISARVDATHTEQVSAELDVQLEGAAGQLAGAVGASGAATIALGSATALFTFKPPSIGSPADPGVMSVSSIPGAEEFGLLAGIVDASMLPGVMSVSSIPGAEEFGLLAGIADASMLPGVVDVSGTLGTT